MATIPETEQRLGRKLEITEQLLVVSADWAGDVLHLFHRPNVDHSDMKLGAKLPVGGNYPRLSEYKKGVALPAQPDTSRGWVTKISDWGMMLNDRLGCCVIANGGHQIMLWSAWGAGLITPADSDIQQEYEEVAGYDPADPSTDRGTDPYAFYQAWLTKGFPVTVGAQQTRHKLSAVTEVNLEDANELKYAINTFATVGLALALPLTAQSQSIWIVDPQGGAKAQPGSWGGHCLAPGTRVLTDDLQWRPIEEMLPGEGLVGFDESVESGKRRQYRRAVITATSKLRLPCYDLVFSDGTAVRASFDHLWLTEGGWQRTEKLRLGAGSRSSQVRKPLEVWNTDTSWGAGYLAGAFDGEGWLSTGGSHRGIHKLGFVQRSNEMFDAVQMELKERDIAFRQSLTRGGFTNTFINQLAISGRQNLLQVLGSLRPQRLLAKFSPDRIGTLNSHGVHIVRKDFVGEQVVVALGTTTKTFLAEGLASHNCVPLVDYTKVGPVCVTWDGLKQMTWDFVAQYGEVVNAAVSTDFLTAAGVDVDSLNLAQLISDEESLQT